jgi:putative PIN family toxin of toxin-antitoxin system
LTLDITCNIIKFVEDYVLDTDVLVAAFRSAAGASRQVLHAVLDRRFEVLLSVPLMLEYEAVLCPPEHLAASGASRADVNDILDGLAAAGKHVKLAFRWRPMLSDANDDMVLETAVNGHAHAIVTFNQRDFKPAVAGFRLLLMSPGKLLRKVKAQGK